MLHTLENMSSSTKPIRTRINAINHVELRVRDLDESAMFYCRMFELLRLETVPPSESTCVCEGIPTVGNGKFGVVLSEGLPDYKEIAGLDHVGLSVMTEQDVRDIYTKARTFGYRVTTPRNFDGSFQIFVFDPDGYKIEIRSDREEPAGQTLSH